MMRAAFLALVLVVVGCGGGSGDGTAVMRTPTPAATPTRLPCCTPGPGGVGCVLSDPLFFGTPLPAECFNLGLVGPTICQCQVICELTGGVCTPTATPKPRH